MSTAITDIGTKMYIKSKVDPYPFEFFTSLTKIGSFIGDPDTHESTALDDAGKTYEIGRPDSPASVCEFNDTSARGAEVRAKMDGITSQTIMVVRKDGSGFITTGVGTYKDSDITVENIVTGSFSFVQSTKPTAYTTAELASYIPAAYGTTVVAPTATPDTGDVADNSTVTLASATSGASIFYTNDGSTPTRSSALYSVPIVITDAVMIKAIAIKAGMNDSPIKTAIYTITA